MTAIQPYICQSQQDFDACLTQLDQFGQHGHEWLNIHLVSTHTYKLATKASTPSLLRAVYWQLGWHIKSSKIGELAFRFFLANQAYIDSQHVNIVATLTAIGPKKSIALTREISNFMVKIGQQMAGKELEKSKREMEEARKALEHLSLQKKTAESELQKLKEHQANNQDTLILCSDGPLVCAISVLSKLPYFTTFVNHSWSETQQGEKIKKYQQQYPNLKYVLNFENEDDSIACSSAIMRKLILLLQEKKIHSQSNDESLLINTEGSKKAEMPKALKEMGNPSELYNLYRLLEIFQDTPDYPLSTWILKKIQEIFSWKDYLAILRKLHLKSNNHLIQLACDQVCNHFKNVSKDPDFKNIQPLYLKEILKRDWICIKDEEELVSLILYWAKSRNNDDKTAALLEPLNDKGDCLVDFLRIEHIANDGFKKSIPAMILNRHVERNALQGTRPLRPVTLLVKSEGPQIQVTWRLTNPHSNLYAHPIDISSEIFEVKGYQLKLHWKSCELENSLINRALIIQSLKLINIQQLKIVVFLNNQPLDISSNLRYRFPVEVDYRPDYKAQENNKTWHKKIFFSAKDQKLEISSNLLEIRVEMKFL